MKKQTDELISFDQALIMALKMHDRRHCGLFRALRAGMQLRCQLNFLNEAGITPRMFMDLLEETKTEGIIDR